MTRSEPYSLGAACRQWFAACAPADLVAARMVVHTRAQERTRGAPGSGRPVCHGGGGRALDFRSERRV